MSSTTLAPEAAGTLHSPRFPAVRGGVRIWLHVEAAAALAVTLMLYGRAGFGWGLFAVLFLVPDLSLLGYLVGPRVGAMAYNIVHSYAGPLALVVLGFVGPAGVMPYALIWLAHCSADRMLGYGLKYPGAARYTHLGLVGRHRAVA